jgi:hypothetical protein
MGYVSMGQLMANSRKIIWMEAYVTNSDPRVICGYYVNAVQSLNGCPPIIRIDAGTENVYVAKMQMFLHGDDSGKSVITGASTGNVRIESWWSRYRKQNAENFIGIFHGLQSTGHFCGDETDKELVRFCFLQVIQVMCENLLFL